MASNSNITRTDDSDLTIVGLFAPDALLPVATPVVTDTDYAPVEAGPEAEAQAQASEFNNANARSLSSVEGHASNDLRLLSAPIRRGNHVPPTRPTRLHLRRNQPTRLHLRRNQPTRLHLRTNKPQGRTTQYPLENATDAGGTNSVKEDMFIIFAFFRLYLFSRSLSLQRLNAHAVLRLCMRMCE